MIMIMNIDSTNYGHESTIDNIRSLKRLVKRKLDRDFTRWHDGFELGCLYGVGLRSQSS